MATGNLFGPGLKILQSGTVQADQRGARTDTKPLLEKIQMEAMEEIMKEEKKKEQIKEFFQGKKNVGKDTSVKKKPGFFERLTDAVRDTGDDLTFGLTENIRNRKFEEALGFGKTAIAKKQKEYEADGVLPIGAKELAVRDVTEAYRAKDAELGGQLIPRRQKGLGEEAIRGMGRGLTFGIVGNRDTNSPTGRAQLEIDPPTTGEKVAGVAGELVGGLVSYGGVAKGLGVALRAAPAIGRFAKTAPFLYGALVENVAQETVEANVRMGTGQDYGPKDFLMGLAFGTAAEGLFAGIRALKGVDIPKVRAKLESTAEDLHLSLGRSPTPDEVYDAVKGDVLPGTNVTFETGLQEHRLIYAKGGKKGIPGIDFPSPPDTPNEGRLTRMLSGEKGERQFLQSVQESDVAGPELKAAAENSAVREYGKLSNVETQREASRIVSSDLNQAKQLLASKETPGALRTSIGMELIGKYQKEGAYEDMRQVLDQVAVNATDQAQGLQAFSMWGRLSPEGAVYTAKRIVDDANEAAPWKRLGKKVQLDNKQIDKISSLAKELQGMPEGPGKIDKTAELFKAIHETVPPTFLQRVESFQTIAQLLNPKTWIRNMLGNLLAAPAEGAANLVAAPVDAGVSMVRNVGKAVKSGNLKDLLDRSTRTKALPAWLRGEFTGADAFWKGLKKGAQDAAKGIDTRTMGKYGRSTQVFTDPILGTLEKTLNVALKSADRAAYEQGFAVSLENAMRAKGLKEPTAEVMEQAVYDGMRRIFENDNLATKAFSKLKSGLNAGQEFGLGSIVLKYPKIPANLILRGLEFSPAGFLRTLGEAAKPLLGYKFNQKALVESFSRALVGSTSMFMGGYYLQKLGILTSLPDEDKDIAAAQKKLGMGQYKLNASALKRFVLSGFNKDAARMQEGDTLVSYDWAQPAAMVLAMGANVAENKGKAGVGSLTAAALSSVQGSIETIENQPLLTGLKRLFLRDPKSATNAFIEAGLDGISSFVPTALRQTNQYMNNVVKETYDPNPLFASLKRAQATIPFLQDSLPDKIDPTTGEQLKRFQDDSNSLVNVFFNPAFISKVKDDPILKEVLGIYERTDLKSQAPRTVERKISITRDGAKEELHLTGQQISEYQKAVAQKTNALFQILMSSPKFMNLEDEQKAEAMAKIVSDVNTAVKVEMFGHRPNSINNFARALIESEPEDRGVKKMVTKDLVKNAEKETVQSKGLKKLFRNLDKTSAKKSSSPGGRMKTISELLNQ